MNKQKVSETPDKEQTQQPEPEEKRMTEEEIIGLLGEERVKRLEAVETLKENVRRKLASRPSRIDNFLKYANSSFVLWVLGACITSFFLPRITKKIDENREQVKNKAAMQETARTAAFELNQRLSATQNKLNALEAKSDYSDLKRALLPYGAPNLKAYGDYNVPQLFWEILASQDRVGSTKQKQKQQEEKMTEVLETYNDLEEIAGGNGKPASTNTETAKKDITMLLDSLESLQRTG